MDSLDIHGEEISGMARCPYDAKHANVALFASELSHPAKSSTCVHRYLIDSRYRRIGSIQDYSSAASLIQKHNLAASLK